jgi:FKBP-type peptidyl-prolyl cis-trans isomerase 2
MRTSQVGDRVQVHYVKRFPNGAVRSSRIRGESPLEVTVGTHHPRLPGLGSELVGLAEGARVQLSIPAERAYGLLNPERIRRVASARFGDTQNLKVGRLARMQLTPGRSRLVRVVEVQGCVVVVDMNHPRAGQALELEVEMVAIATAAPESGHWGP